ncbi:MAG: hypothetical protein ACI8P0_005648 [Planctomycetaceae bacterium]|jgi:hypothetical protein
MSPVPEAPNLFPVEPSTLPCLVKKTAGLLEDALWKFVTSADWRLALTNRLQHPSCSRIPMVPGFPFHHAKTDTDESLSRFDNNPTSAIRR